MKYLFINIIFILLLSCNVFAADDGSTAPTKTGQSDAKETTATTEAVKIQQHPCQADTKSRGYNTGSKSTGILRYDIDCAPFHTKDILDFSSTANNWSVLVWVNRMMRFFYRLSVVIGIIGLFWAGVKYAMAGGGEAGMSSAKASLMAALMGFVVGGTAWTIVAMWSKAMNMIT